jgi:hypothetical protein
LGMMPFLIVSAVREPTVMAPSISKMVPKIMAWRYDTERDETDVAQALATSSASVRCDHDGSGVYSLAPLLYASRSAKNVPMAKM